MTKPRNLVAAITDAARRVYGELHSGFEESVYQQALAVELRRVGLAYEVERNIEVFYKNERVGLHRIDFVVERSVIVELKVVAKLSPQNVAQTSAYSRTTGICSAVIINFPSPAKESIEFQEHTIAPDETLVNQKQIKKRNRGRVTTVSKHRPNERRRPFDELEWDPEARGYVAKNRETR